MIFITAEDFYPIFFVTDEYVWLEYVCDSIWYSVLFTLLAWEPLKFSVKFNGTYACLWWRRWCWRSKAVRSGSATHSLFHLVIFTRRLRVVSAVFVTWDLRYRTWGKIMTMYFYELLIEIEQNWGEKFDSSKTKFLAKNLTLNLWKPKFPYRSSKSLIALVFWSKSLLFRLNFLRM